MSKKLYKLHNYVFNNAVKQFNVKFDGLSDNFGFRPDLFFAEDIFLSFSKAIISFETVSLEIQNIWEVLVTLAATIRAPTI